MRSVQALSLLLGTLLFTLPASAQELGDRVRLRMADQEPSVEGSFTEFEPGLSISVIPSMRGQAFAYDLAAIQRADWYKPRSLLRDLALGSALTGAILLIDECAFTGTCIGASKTTHAAVIFSISIGLDVLAHLIWPGSWKTWIEDGRLTN